MNRTIAVIFIGFLTSISLFLVSEIYAQNSNTEIINDIRNAYEGMDFDVAEARIVDAIEKYDRFLPAELAEIHVIYALVLFTRNDLAGAESQLLQALQLTPSLELDTLDTPPRLMESFQRIKSNLDEPLDFDGTQVKYVILDDVRAEAALRSMILPGWGQIHKGDNQKGLMLAGLWATTAGGSVVAHYFRGEARKQYDASETIEQTQERFQAFSNWHKIRNNLMLAAAGVWMISYVDAIITGKPTVDGSPLNNRVRVSGITLHHASRFSVTLYF